MSVDHAINEFWRRIGEQQIADLEAEDDSVSAVADDTLRASAHPGGVSSASPATGPHASTAGPRACGPVAAPTYDPKGHR